MNNEPVAWLPKGMTLAKPKDLTDCIPLYTHPANTPKAVKTYTEGNPNYVTEINDKQYNAIDNTEPRSSDTCGR